MGYSRKNQTVGVEDILFWKKKNPGVFHFFTLYFEGKFYTAVFLVPLGLLTKYIYKCFS